MISDFMNVVFECVLNASTIFEMNSGTHKQDIEDYNKGKAAERDPERDGNNAPKEETTNGDVKSDEQSGKESDAAPVEEEAKEYTLDEWKAQRAERAKPQYNLRKAGEGEDNAQWKKMVALESRKKKVIHAK